MTPLTLEDRRAVVDDVIGALASKALGQKHDATGTPQSTGYMHGPGGLMSYPGPDPVVYSTEVGAYPGVFSVIPHRPSVYTDPLFEVWIGQYGDNGTEREAECDPAPTPGLAKAGLLWAPFGRYARATPELSIARLGQLRDRADPVGLRFANTTMTSAPMGSPESSNQMLQDMLTNELSAALRRRNVSMNRLLHRQAWSGNPANNNGTAYMEFPGLSLLVATGHTDAVTGTALPSVDSVVQSFNHQRVDQNGGDLVDMLSTTLRYLRSLAMRTGIDPVEHAIFMREELFWEITKVWPCSYLTMYCDFGSQTDTRLNVDARDQTEFRDDMRRNRYLIVDGIRYNVIVDDGIPELNGNDSGGNFAAGCFESDIYVLPLTAQGSAVLFAEYFDFNNTAIQEAVRLLAPGAAIRQAGAFLELRRQLNNCFTLEIETQPRLILRTPWLAARINDVVYCPALHTRQPFPDDPYWTNGGETTRSGPSYYAGWKS